MNVPSSLILEELEEITNRLNSITNSLMDKRTAITGNSVAGDTILAIKCGQLDGIRTRLNIMADSIRKISES